MDIDKPKRATPSWVNRARGVLIFADDAVHVIVAAFLVVAAFIMFYYAAKNLTDISVAATLMVVNDVLFVLIIAELLWTIIRYLRREKFSLAPFLFMGIISSLRRMLYIDAQMSLGTGERTFEENIMELGIHVTIIFVLVVAYYLIRKVNTASD
ncbi:MAG: phosphate-starvation-inducible PsiE family protein [Thermoleophilia bacterium]